MASYGVQLKDKNGNKVYPSPYWPIGSIYLSVTNVNPGTIFGGTWQKIATGRVLMGASNDSQLGTTIDSGLPNITGQFTPRWADNSGQGFIMGGGTSGSFYSSWSGVTNFWADSNQNGGSRDDRINFDASRVNAIYGRSSIVQPPALYCYIWQRTA